MGRYFNCRNHHHINYFIDMGESYAPNSFGDGD